MEYRFQGTFYFSGSSQSLELAVLADLEGRVVIEVEGQRLAYAKTEYEVEPRLGSARRVLTFRDGARFETEHCPEFERFERASRSGGWLSLVDWLERRWMTALGSVTAVAIATTLFFVYGIPALANYVADNVPQEMREKISRQSLNSMLRFGQLEESELSGELTLRSQNAFARALQIAGLAESAFSYELKHYSMHGIENAFAFPSGTIVATDSFAEMCKTEEQLVAVFLHEIAHVERQHGIRSIVQRTGVVVIASMVLGDISSVANVTAALPTLLIESQYSQRFELESDTFAAELLERSGVGAEAMREVLILLHKDSPEVSLATFLSSHPSLRERIANIERIQGEGARE